MRIRPVLAIAHLALWPGAPASAAQLPAQEIEFLEISDPYPWFAGLATRTILRNGHVFVVGTPYGGGIAAYFVDYPDLGVSGYVSPHAPACSSAQECINDSAINQAGRVVGAISFIINFGNPPINWVKPMQYRYSVSAQGLPSIEIEDLTMPPGYPAAPTSGAYGAATAINDHDLIAGVAKSSNPAVGEAPVWWASPTAVAQELPRLAGANAGPFPARINDAGVIVGNTGGSAPQRAAVWKPDSGGYSLALLGELPGGASSRAYDIGRFGRIVGRSDDGSGTPIAVVWKPSGSGYAVTPLPVPPGGSCSAATAINDRSDIAGNCTTGGGDERGVIWKNALGTYELAHELDPLPSHTRSVAYALDDTGQAGGGSGPSGAERAVLWPSVPAAPASVPALSHVSLLCLAAVIAVASAATLRAH